MKANYVVQARTMPYTRSEVKPFLRWTDVFEGEYTCLVKARAHRKAMISEGYEARVVRRTERIMR